MEYSPRSDDCQAGLKAIVWRVTVLGSGNQPHLGLRSVGGGMRDVLGIIFGLAGGAALTALSQIHPPTSPFWYAVLYVSIAAVGVIVIVFCVHLFRTRSRHMIGIDALIVVSAVILISAIVWRFHYRPFAANAELSANVASPRILLKHEGGQFEIWNYETGNIYFQGMEIGGARDIVDVARVIVPGTHYYLRTHRIEAELLSKMPDNSQAPMPMALFILDEKNRRMTAKFHLAVTVQNRTVAINTQYLGASNGWPAF